MRVWRGFPSGGRVGTSIEVPLEDRATVIITRTAHIATTVVAVSLTVGLASAESVKCVPELPIKRTEHWSYRIVNGQRCWFSDSERTTVGKKLEVERKAHAQKSAQRSSPKIGLSRPPSAAKSGPQVADAFAEARNDHVTHRPKFDLRESAPIVDNEPETTASFAEAWNDRVTPRDPFSQIAIATSKVVPTGPTEATLPHSPVAGQQTASPPMASTANFVGVMLWFGMGMGMLGLSLFGRTAWKKLRQQDANLMLNKKQQSIFLNKTIDVPN